jgi:murein DD-endopeptidase MepM/ murein hydrolase activator NlpD
MQSPVKKEYITQTFGANWTAYAKFGLKGHNGLDFRAFLPNGTRCYEGGKSEVFAPHDGKTIENALDPQGYGWYVKIENEKEGSVLAHLHTESPLKVGSTVKQGQLVGYQGTTGNSTGIHLHWGYYPIPRNRQNGYNGYINQAGLYQPYGEETMPDTMTIEKSVFENLVTKSTKYDEIVNAGYVTKADYDKRVNEITTDLNISRERLVMIKDENVRLESDVEALKAYKSQIEQQLDECKNKLLATPPPEEPNMKVNGKQVATTIVTANGTITTTLNYTSVAA